MRNKLIFATVFLIGLLFPFISVSALTEINFEEKDNGRINTKLHFEEGFVGGIDITIKIDGDVSVKDFEFSNKIVSNKYGYEYKYDETKNTLNIIVTTGGIGTKHNLLNSNKELELGQIVLTSTASDDVKYKLSESSFKIVDNNWSSKVIEQSHITLGKKEFTYKVEKVDNPPKDDNENNDNQDDDNKEITPNDKEDQPNDEPELPNVSNDDNSNTEQNNNQIYDNSSNVNDKTASNDKSKDDDKVSTDENDKVDNDNSKPDDKTDKPVIDSDKITDNTTEVTEEKSFNYFSLIVIGIVLVVVIGSGIYLFNVKRK